MKKPTDIDKSTVYYMSLLPSNEYISELLVRMSSSKLSKYQKLEFVQSLCALYGVTSKSGETGWKFISKEIEAFKPEEKEETKVDLQS